MELTGKFELAQLDREEFKMVIKGEPPVPVATAASTACRPLRRQLLPKVKVFRLDAEE